MLEVLLFSFSISIDAMGLSFIFGSKNFKLTKPYFLFLNALNTIFLIFFLLLFPMLNIFNTVTLNIIGCFILISLGSYYIISSLLRAVKRYLEFVKPPLKKKIYFNKKPFSLKEFFTLTLCFLGDDILSSIVFYSSFSYHVLFIVSTFLFHYLFFSIGFDLGEGVAKRNKVDSSFISGVISILLGFFNLYF